MRLLLISNSTNAGEEYLTYPLGEIERFLGGIKSVAFIPYAGVTITFDAYLERVAERFGRFGARVDSVHKSADPAAMVRGAEAIAVGGGNTFALVKRMQDEGLIEAVRECVQAGVPYIGWSAGSNIAAPTLCTTNDMPVVEPASFRTMGLVGFQINPHYLDVHPDGHAGETREQRIEEYIEANRGTIVVGLREGCMLCLEGGRLELLGRRRMRVFRYGAVPYELLPGDDLSFLL